MKKKTSNKKPRKKTNTLFLKRVGKSRYYADPLKGFYRNVEDPKDIYIPETKKHLSRMLDNVRDYGE